MLMMSIPTNPDRKREEGRRTQFLIKGGGRDCLAGCTLVNTKI